MASLRFEEGWQGGVLRVNGTEANVQLALVAPLPEEDDPGFGGLMAVYRAEQMLAALSTTPDLGGRLSLAAIPGDGGDARYILRGLTETVDRGGDGGQQPDIEKAGSLVLRTLSHSGSPSELVRLRSAARAPTELVATSELGTSRRVFRLLAERPDRFRRRGQLELYDTAPGGDFPPGDAEPRARLGSGDRGGELWLEGSERRVELDQRGIRIGSPPPDGAVRDQVRDPFEAPLRDPDVREVGGRGPARAPSASLGMTAEGRPYLLLDGPDRAVRIDENGISASPDKAGFLFFLADHPQDPSRQIRYCVVEGPEVGVYSRGTLRLHQGRAIGRLPEHFGLVASPEGLTVQLTPRSAESKGVAAVKLTTTELEVRELHGGTGSYEVDYQVNGVRLGREEFEVIVERSRDR